MLHIVLMFVVMQAVQSFQDVMGPLECHWEGWVDFAPSGHSLIVLFGGVFIMYTALKEISHMLVIEQIEAHQKKPPASVRNAITMIVVMNLIFSFDSTLRAWRSPKCSG